MTGIHAEEGINVDDANAIGEQGMTEMTSKNVVCYTFKRRQQTATFASKSLIKIGDVQLQVDPQLPFKRIIIASASLDYDKEEAITYKLSSCPSTCLVRELQKLVSWSYQLKLNQLKICNMFWMVGRYCIWWSGHVVFQHAAKSVSYLYCNYVTRKYEQA